MSKITLSTLNARYIHTSLGLRYLLANMGALIENTHIQEFNINARPIDIVESLLSSEPDIIGFGIYIWNIEQTTEVIKLIKTVSPQTKIIIGGPEVSYEYHDEEILKEADYLITGAADLAFTELCQSILKGCAPSEKVIRATLPALELLELPYAYYTDEDIANRIIYVEASRGCPFKCEFCLSAIDKTAIAFDLDLFLNEMQLLYQRGARHFKFVDRTFNLKINSSIKILNFFLGKLEKDDLFLHFELIPDHLPDKLKTLISQFPAHSLQFEIGIQSLNPMVQQLISRKQDTEKTRLNLEWLHNNSNAHIHADLIIGLPGEDIESFSKGFDLLIAMKPDEIQVGILKRLKGTPIIRHTNEFDLRFNPCPPYNILSNNLIKFTDMQKLQRFARYWDMIANSGRFSNSMPFILGETPFNNFMRMSEWLFNETGQTHKLALERLFKLVYRAMTDKLQLDSDSSEEYLLADFDRSGIKGKPCFSNPHNTGGNSHKTKIAQRQKQHSH